MAASPAIKLREPLEALFRNAGVPDDFYRRYKERLLDMDVGDAGDLLEEVALKGIASLCIQQRQAEKLRRYLLGRRGWEDAAAVLASFGRLSLDDTPPGVAAGDQAAGGAASASALDGMDVDGGYASAEEDAGPAGGGPAAAAGSKMEPGCPRSGAGTSAAAAGGEGAVAGSVGCGGTRTPEAESGAREARAAVVAGGGGPAVSVDTSDSTPPAEGGEGGCPRSLLDPGRAHVCVTAGISSPEALASGEACAPSFSSSVRPRDPAVGGSTAEAIAEAAVEAVYGALVLEALEEWAGASAGNPLDHNVTSLHLLYKPVS
ncbi:hypothetical protein EMIHUDRAFT_236818 [Emiliania huxleyi CCMP1516]|uniref:SAM domain-containing protein n=2 Tax=Emiliania huxleyi TaxID=2903 RepID=A0A0D3JRV6_EMIH1|nr:hypothetical protein EMIHUDRAFT_236818 [Emiliania huxleyi CCMP1516]EOD26241.1 hypothetical protein EMIHUDRAFT_236818 [Emiliania huxleyi CCMP1516]|eukprot:XP_005778670.1 hypothetical protein EMIHUDRAFT_236818 [Emiliania huxleyi CCMP1516]